MVVSKPSVVRSTKIGINWHLNSLSKIFTAQLLP